MYIYTLLKTPGFLCYMEHVSLAFYMEGKLPHSAVLTTFGPVQSRKCYGLTFARNLIIVVVIITTSYEIRWLL